MTTKARVRKLIRELGGADHIHQGLRQYQHSVAQMEIKRGELLAQYPDKWVAIAEGEVVAVDDSLEAVLSTIEGKGIARTGAVVEFLDTDPLNMIL